MDKLAETNENGNYKPPDDDKGGDADHDTDIELVEKPLIYGITENPPFHIMLVAGLQQGLLGLAGQLAVAILVADVVCAANDDVLKARILSSTLFMDGLTTVAMVLLGSRLPVFQGASPTYVIPLLMMGSIQDQFCSSEIGNTAVFVNGTLDANFTEMRREKALQNLQSLQGSLMLAGIIQALVGMTGMVGFLLRFIGPLTVVPSMLLSGIYLVTPVTNFAQVHWGISVLTAGVAIVLSLYLEKWQMPIPAWTPSRGFCIIRYPVQQMFAILIAMLFGWMLSGILTATDVFPDDPTHPGYNARTDSRIDGVSQSRWFLVPYPGQFGTPSFSVPGFIAFIIATLLAILDSVGDYYACARVCRVPAPPAHAVNRGILIEGTCSFLSGAVGCGNATNSYGGNVGAIGITKVASRNVFVCVGLVYMVFGVIGKFSAVFISIPYPVLGGALIMVFGIFIGVVLSNLEVVSLTSSRNLAVLGISVFTGILIPKFLMKNPKALNVGNEAVSNILTMVLGNPNFAGTIIACFLDNTVPGSTKDRGIDAWRIKEDDEHIDETLYDHGLEIYRPFLPSSLRSSKLLNYIPFLPRPTVKESSDLKRKV